MRLIPLLLLGLLCLSACVCTRDVAHEPGNSPGDGALHAYEELVLEGEVVLTPLDDGTGYRVSGPQHLEGTLRYDGEQWHLVATFTFPTAGYTVEDLDVAVLKRLPEEVRIAIPYQPPPIDALVAQVLTEAPVAWSGSVSRDATFTLEVQRIPPGTAAEAGR